MSPKRRAKGDGTLFQRRDGYWVGGVEIPTTDGKRRWKRVVRKDFKAASVALRELRKELEAGRIPTTSNTTVERWLGHWLETIHRPNVKPTTYRSTELSVRAYINPTVGGKRLDRLTPEDVRGMHRALQADKKDAWKGSTRNAQKAHQVLQQALKDAVNEGVVVRNVAAATKKPKHAKEKRDAFTLSVASHIIRTAERHSDVSWATRWALGFTTGARQGEILGLEWSRVNLEAGLLDLSWQLQQLQMVHGCGGECGRSRPGWCPQAKWDLPAGFEYREIERSVVLTRPKSAAGTRVVPLLPPVVAALKQLKQAEDDNPHGLVFRHPDGKPITPYQDTKQWKLLLQTAEIPHAPLHTMRHSTATILMEAGIDALVIQSILGHSDVLTTRSYQHADISLARQAITALMPLTG